MPASQALREYGESKVARLEKYYNGIIDGKVTFSAEKTSQKAEVTLKTDGPPIRGEASGADAYAALDVVIDKLSRQLRKAQDKQKTHKAGASVKTMERTEAEEKPKRKRKSARMRRRGEAPEILLTKTFAMKPMFPDDAMIQLEQSADEFLVFINAESYDVNVLYRRTDGHYGLIEPDR
jgi:putative sigma-54 modulation protein